MMNDIKFRAWDKKDFKVRQVLGMSFVHGAISVELNNEEYLQDNASRFEVMQYTGLKDKNGVEIYEGDILKVFVLDSKEPHAKVELKNGIFGIEDDMFGYGFYKGHYSLHQILSRYDAEVIGNIYENPELMEDN